MTDINNAFPKVQVIRSFWSVSFICFDMRNVFFFHVFYKRSLYWGFYAIFVIYLTQVIYDYRGISLPVQTFLIKAAFFGSRDRLGQFTSAKWKPFM